MITPESFPGEIELRVQGGPRLPNLIYLPGLHGDWTLTPNLARELTGRVRFIVITYPRSVTWSLDDYAAAVEAALATMDVRSGWLLGESFSSQVVWALVGRAVFKAQGIILAGGFVRHPWPWLVRPAGVFCHRWFLRALWPAYRGYVTCFRAQKSAAPESQHALAEFVARRTVGDLQAMRHRLALIAANDPRSIARNTQIPVHALSGAFDPIVPWPFVRFWLRRNCPALRDYHVIMRADHNVLQMAAPEAAAYIYKWMGI